MKIKVRPDDFIVEEVADIKINNSGKYFLYILEKVNWNTLDAIKQIAKVNKIPQSLLSYCGKKDRYAHTFQYITSTTRLSTEKINDNIKITYLGKTNENAVPSLIQKNKFTLKIRDISDEDIKKITQRIEEIKKYGFPNYFGDQRFGSYDKNFGFFGEKFLKAQYNGALKCLLCSIHSEDDKSTKDRKRLFFQNWGDFDKLKDFAKTKLEKNIFQILNEKPKGFLNAIHIYPTEEISMAFSAYQSYLWNNMLKKLLLNLGSNYKISIKEWLYPIYKTLPDDEFKNLKNLIIPTPGIKPFFSNDYTEKIYDEVLKEEGLYQARFSQRKYRKVIIKSFPHNAIVIPEDIIVLQEGEDELYKGKKFITLSFSLPKGSYATVLIKTLEV